MNDSYFYRGSVGSWNRYCSLHDANWKTFRGETGEKRGGEIGTSCQQVALLLKTCSCFDVLSMKTTCQLSFSFTFHTFLSSSPFLSHTFPYLSLILSRFFIIIILTSRLGRLWEKSQQQSSRAHINFAFPVRSCFSFRLRAPGPRAFQFLAVSEVHCQ